MSFVKTWAAISLFLALSLSCGMQNDLFPSDEDKRPKVEPGSSGNYVSQISKDFTLTDVRGEKVSLYERLARGKSVLLYFTMWCPICNSHTDYMLQKAVPKYGASTDFILVDYISSSVKNAETEAKNNGYIGAPLSILSDHEGALIKQYDATMAITVIIDKDKIIRFNEDFKDGVRVLKILEAVQ